MNLIVPEDTVVCDTDAASYVVKLDPIRGPRYLQHLQKRVVVLPFCVISELRLGAEVRNWGSSRIRCLNQFIADAVVVYPNDRLCTLWSAVVAQQRRSGRAMGQHDGWVAATALLLEVPVVTHNAAHYDSIPDLQILTEPDR